MFRKSIFYFGKLLSYVFPYKLSKVLLTVQYILYTGWISKEFKEIGKKTVVRSKLHLIGGKHISIGHNSTLGKRCVITAWSSYLDQKLNPNINIGNNVVIGDDSHITCSNIISIGDNVLTGKKITITDNAHGESNRLMLDIAPIKRPIFSNGPVIIGEGVWIGEKVTILPNVNIGKNAIIGSNAVVTKDIPENSVAIGVPAKVIKVIKE